MSEQLIRAWHHSPDAHFGNAVGIAFSNIAKAWSEGIFQLEDSRPFSPFWNRFCDHYAPDHELATKLNGALPAHDLDWASWCPYSSKDLDFWQQMMPYVVRTLFPLIESFADPRKTMSGAGSHPLLHFRAGDVPFLRHNEYRFPKYSFYRHCIHQYSDHKHWTIITSFNAMTRDQQNIDASRIYLEDVCQFLADHDITVDVRSDGGLFEDLSTMIAAPILLTSMLSSFSYFIGLAKPEGSFTSAYSDMCSTIPEWMSLEPALRHREVDDYFDCPRVIAQLRKGAYRTYSDDHSIGPEIWCSPKIN